MKSLIAHLVFTVAFAYASPVPAQAGQESEALLQLRLENSVESLKKLTDQQHDLENAGVKLEQGMIRAEEAARAIDLSRIEEVAKSARAILELSPDRMVSDNFRELSDYQRQCTSIFRALIPTFRELASVNSRLDVSLDFTSGLPGVGSSLLDCGRSLWSALPSDSEVAIGTLKAELDSIRRDLDFLVSKDFVGRLKDNLLAPLRELQEKNKTELAGLSQELQKEEKRMEDLNAKLQERASSRTVADAKLVWAVFVMLLVLLLMFFMLKYFPTEVTTRLVDARTFVEVISIAFLLLTIILLGTAGKLEVTSLGTLLGTIAGYVFGRGMTGPGVEQRNSNG